MTWRGRQQEGDKERCGERRAALGNRSYTCYAPQHPLDETQTGSMAHLDADRVFAYDTLNRLLTGRLGDTQDWDASSEETTWYSYDDLGNRISHQYRDASAIGYQHDKANRMTMLADKTQRYDAAGNLTVAYSADRSVSYKYAYDHHNRLTWVGEITGGTEPNYTTTRKATFAWDATGSSQLFLRVRRSSRSTIRGGQSRALSFPDPQLQVWWTATPAR